MGASLVNMAAEHRPSVLMLGTGEYTTGFTANGASNSDKSTGVVALVLLDLKRRGKLGPRLGMCGVNGKKLPAIREHMSKVLGDVYTGIDPSIIETWPADDQVDAEAYKTAVATYRSGDVAIVFTPDDTHFAITEECLKHGMHVLVTKPPTKTLADHNALAAVAAIADRLCAIEVHKRFDPIYVDARDRIAALGPFSYMAAYMSQPKHQLDTFKAWAGKSSDISYYLNSHHIDFHEWAMQGNARPERVTALGFTGVADARLDNGVHTEDTITLAVQWRNRTAAPTDASNEPPAKKQKQEAASAAAPFTGGTLGHAMYTSSWIAPKSDVHSQQRWFYMGHHGEINVDQAHRGYTVATDAAGFGNVNPLFWKPAPDARTGEFVGQRCYGYISFEAFVDGATKCNASEAKPADFNGSLPTMATTAGATAILEAGRMSLDSDGQSFELVYESDTSCVPVSIRPVK